MKKKMKILYLLGADTEKIYIQVSTSYISLKYTLI